MSTSVLDLPQARNVLFHPSGESPWHVLPAGAKHVQLAVEPAVSVVGRLYPTQSADPLLLLFHGNGEIAADYDGLAPLYNRMGVNLLVMDYRGYGRSTGTPTAAHLLSDAVLVADEIESLVGYAPRQLFVMGRSLGSAAAIQVARQSQVELSGLIIESGFADTFALLARMGVHLPQAQENKDGLANLAKISQVLIPTLVIHGQADILIPAGDGRALYERCGAQAKELLLVPGAGHNDLILVGRAQYFQALRDFLFPGNG